MQNISKANFINFNSLPSLESIAIVNIAITLWGQPDLKPAIQKHVSNLNFRGRYSISDRDSSFNEIEKSVSEKLSVLPLPYLLKLKVNNAIRPIGLQIMSWVDSMKQMYFSFYDVADIHWTMDGIIDRAKSLNCINRNFENSSCSVFSLACLYCSKDYIKYLWQKMSEDAREEIKRKISYGKFGKIVLYWICFLQNDLPYLKNIYNQTYPNDLYDIKNSIYQNMFTFSIYSGNVVGAKYFWQYLTHEEIIINIEKWVDDIASLRKNCCQYDYQETNNYTDTLCFLLSHMNDLEKQKSIFQKYDILEWLFLDWPWQKFLLPTIQVMWDYLDEIIFIKLLSRIAREVKEGRSTEKLLRELWHGIPNNLKRCFFQPGYCYMYDPINVFWKLLESKDIESLKLILNDALSDEKKQIAFAIVKNKHKLFELVYASGIEMLNIFIKETLSLKCEIEDFKQSVVMCAGNKLCHKWFCTDNWKEAENFLEWGFTSKDQIEKFKNNFINKKEIVGSLVSLKNYELADKFLNWCFRREEEAYQFKKDLLHCREFDDIVEMNDLNSFNNLIVWCFNSDNDINQFKMDISDYSKMTSIIYKVIVYKYNFIFANQLLGWCYNTKEDIQQFKEKFILSEAGMEMFTRFVTNYKLYGSGYSNWQLVEKLAKWFYPTQEHIINEFKNEAKNRKSSIFGPEKCSPFYSSKGKQQALFYLLDVYAKFKDSSNLNSNLMDEINDDDSDSGLNRNAAELLYCANDSSDSINSESD